MCLILVWVQFPLKEEMVKRPELTIYLKRKQRQQVTVSDYKHFCQMTMMIIEATEWSFAYRHRSKSMWDMQNSQKNVYSGY